MSTSRARSVRPALRAAAFTLTFALLPVMLPAAAQASTTSPTDEVVLVEETSPSLATEPTAEPTLEPSDDSVVSPDSSSEPAPATTDPNGDGPTDAVAAEPAASCADGSVEGLTATDAQRFVDMWVPRVLDSATFDALNAAELPAEILAEGFHDRPQDVQRYLAGCLANALAAQLSAQDGTSFTAEQLTQAQQALYALIFERAWLQTPPAADGDAVPATPAEEQIPAELRDRLEAHANAPVPTPVQDSDVAPSSVTPAPQVAAPPVTDVVPGAPLDQAAPQVQELLSAGTTPAEAAVEQVQRLTEPLRKLLGGLGGPEPVSALLQQVRNLTTTQRVSTVQPDGTVVGPDALRFATGASKFPADLPLDVPVLSSLTYRVCQQTDAAASCSLPLPIGVPAVLDVTADSVPDLVAQLAPSTDTNDLSSVGLDYRLMRLPTASRPDLRAHVFVLYDVPQAERRFAFGYDGRAAGLSRNTTTNLRLRDALAATRDDVTTALRTVHQDQPATWALTAGSATLTGDTTTVTSLLGDQLAERGTHDPMAGLLRQTPVPTTLEGELQLVRQNTQDSLRTTLELSQRTLLEALFVADVTGTGEAPTERAFFGAIADQMATSSELELRNDRTDVRRSSVRLQTNQQAGRLLAAAQLQPDATDPGTRQLLFTALQDLPTRVQLSMERTAAKATGRYSADRRLGQLEALYADYAAGALTKALVATARDLPTTMTLSGDQPGQQNAELTYTADSALPRLQAGYFDRDRQNTLVLADVHDVPTAVTYTADGPTGRAQLLANAPIGLIDAVALQNGGGLARLADDHATLVRDGQALGASIRVAGLKLAVIDAGSDEVVGSVELGPGGQPFVAGALLDNDVLGLARWSALPGNTTVRLGADNTANYRADRAIPQLDVYFTRTAGPTVVGGLTGVPTSADLAWDSTGTPGANLVSSDGLDRLTLLALPAGPGYDPQTVPFLDLDAQNLPAELDGRLDLARSQLRWTASAPTGLIDATVRYPVADRTYVGTAQVTSLPARWEASYASGDLGFRGLSGPIGELAFAATNTSTFAPAYTGPFASVRYDQDSGDLAASARLPQLLTATYRRSDRGIAANLQLDAGHQQVVLDGVAQLSSGDQVTALVGLTGLPTNITISTVGDTYRYTANRNVDVVALAAFGRTAALATTANPPLRRGLSVRDGSCGTGCTAVRAALFLQGAPTAVTADLDPGVVTVTNYRPPAAPNDFLDVDLVLNHVVGTPVQLLARQEAILGPVSLTAGPFLNTTLPDGRKKVDLTYQSSAQLGRFSARGAYGSTAGYVDISSIPTSAKVSGTFGARTDATLALGQPVAHLQIGALGSFGATTFDAAARLTDIPTRVSIQTGTKDGSQTSVLAPPLFRYSANASTLDLLLSVGTDLVKRTDAFGLENPSLQVSATDLGADTRVVVDPSNKIARILSPAGTGELLLRGSAVLTVPRQIVDQNLINELDGLVKFGFYGHYGLQRSEIADLQVYAQGFRDVTLDAGGPASLTVGVEGSFNRFVLTWGDRTRLNLDVDVEARGSVTFLGLSASIAPLRATFIGTYSTNIFTVFDNTFRALAVFDNPIAGDCNSNYAIEMQPGPRAKFVNGVAFNNPATEGGPFVFWFADPSDRIPGLLTAAGVYFTTPYPEAKGIRARTVDACPFFVS